MQRTHLTPGRAAHQPSRADRPTHPPRAEPPTNFRRRRHTSSLSIHVCSGSPSWETGVPIGSLARHCSMCCGPAVWRAPSTEAASIARLLLALSACAALRPAEGTRPSRRDPPRLPAQEHAAGVLGSGGRGGSGARECPNANNMGHSVSQRTQNESSANPPSRPRHPRDLFTGESDPEVIDPSSKAQGRSPRRLKTLSPSN